MFSNYWNKEEIETLHRLKMLPLYKQAEILHKSIDSISAKRRREKLTAFRKHAFLFTNKICPSCKNMFYGERKTCSELCRRKSHGEIVVGEKSGMWKGDWISEQALHQWVQYHKPKPVVCVRCNQRPAYDLANISGQYKRDVNDFEWLCRKCHTLSDGRIQRLIDFKKYRFKKGFNSIQSMKEAGVI